jgi:periplasmic protein TonB
VARRLGIQGAVEIETIIDEYGNVMDPVATKDPGYGLGAAALDVVRTWKYKPATLNGRAVRVYMTITLNFHLSGAA